MTGNTMAYFPSGSNVYQQFMHESTFSLPSYLKSLGYDCTAIHPSSGSNWNRIAAYKSMGFDDFITIEKFKKPEYVRYISDKESYKKVIEQFENKGDNPLYVFDMTIQNHGGYLTNTDWDDPVYVENTYYDEAKEYLSAIHVSDEAFEYLIDYFSKQTEPTLICMFGDHFPSIETSFYQDLLGKTQDEWDLDDIQKRYAVPFIIWANYDIQEESSALISNNYLENMILKQAGLTLPKYNQYLETLSQVIPAMNVNGYMDTTGQWHYYSSDESDVEKNLLENYEILQYGYYSDSDKEKMAELFQMKN
jgi:phosphoglycerol transferase MdoB-like AlkP superfamily enzyme